MDIIKVTNSQEGGKVAFNLMKQALKEGARTFGLATGSSPISLYEELVASELDFSDCRSINLDEYVGLGPDDDQSYAYFMNQHLFAHKPFKESFLPNGLTEDLDAELLRYDALLEQYPIDFQILGIGTNGHIGFNEPGTPIDTKTQQVALTEETIQANARFFETPNQVPRSAISMGISSIMAAKTVVLLAYGAQKADAVYGMVRGEVTTALPASVLQNHPRVYLIVDEAAASRL